MLKFKVFLVFLLMLLGITVNAAEDRYIIKFNDSVQLFSAGGSKNNKDYLSVSADELQDYIDAGIVEYYEPDYEVKLDAAFTWNLASVKLDFPHSIGCLGTDVRIGVIDSGITEGIFPNVLPGYNYIDGNTDTTDTTLHGTMVSAIAAYSPFGVAVDAKIVPLKCFKDGVKTYVSDILDAVVDAVDVYHCDVINMSFGVAKSEGNASDIRILKEKIKYAAKKGVILVASVGNDESSIIKYPAAFDNVIGVGSVDKDGQWSDFSNYNKSVYVVAPGEDVIAPYIKEGVLSQEYVLQVDGTSFSAPHVAGLAAIAKCIDKDITQAEFAALIAKTAVETEPDTVVGWDRYYGYGMIDCEAVVKKLIEGQKMHISPIRQNGEYTFTTVYNNTSSIQNPFVICAGYDDSGRFTGYIPITEEFGEYKARTFRVPRIDGTMKYMVLSNDGGIIPLATAKEK